MRTTISRGDVLASLAGDYRRRLEQLAKRLRPKLESGELREWWDEDGDRYPRRRGRWAPPLWRLEHVCQRAFARTEEDALLTLAVSPAAKHLDACVQLGDVCQSVSEAVAEDLLALARRRGWYRPAFVVDRGARA